MDHLSQTTLAILAGGAGSRMGFAKSLLTVDGQPILEHLLNRLQWPGPTILVTAPSRGHPPGWERFDREAVDSHFGGGPLVGILTALQTASTPYVLLLTVDMPTVERKHLQPLLDAMAADSTLAGAMMTRTLDGRQQVEPFPCIISRSAITLIVERLANGRRSVHRLLDDPRFASVAAPAAFKEAPWVNLNTPAEASAFGVVRADPA